MIYQCLSNELMSEISKFWQSHDIPSQMLSLDTDQLQGIVIYMVSRLNYPSIIADVQICEKFLPNAVRKSSRYLYLEMVSAAIGFLLEQDSSLVKEDEDLEKWM